MASREIVLWLDERWYDALEKHINGETLRDKLDSYIDELVDKLVPDDESEQISREIYEESVEREARREAERRFSVFRIREKGEKCCCLVEEPIDILAAARSLRRYVRSDMDTGFRAYYAAAQEITWREFSEYLRERQEDTGRVVGAFDVDLDSGTVATLDVKDGWRLYCIKDVSTAAYRADRKSDESHIERMNHLLDYLKDKMLPEQGYYPEGYITFGSRELQEEDVLLADEISEIDGKLDFYMESFDGLDDVFGTHVCTEENDDYVNVYADYDLNSGTLDDTLLVVLHRGDGTDEQHEYPLSPREQALLFQKMEAYCLERTGMGFEDHRERYLAERQSMGRELTL